MVSRKNLFAMMCVLFIILSHVIICQSRYINELTVECNHLNQLHQDCLNINNQHQKDNQELIRLGQEVKEGLWIPMPDKENCCELDY